LAQRLAAILEDTRLLLQDIEVDDDGRQAVALAERRHAKIIEDLQAVRERWLRIEDESVSSVERNEISTQMKDIKTRIKADTSWLTMKHTEYTQ
jgi:DNA polymerase III delta prime subunit